MLRGYFTHNSLCSQQGLWRERGEAKLVEILVGEPHPYFFLNLGYGSIIKHIPDDSLIHLSILIYQYIGDLNSLHFYIFLNSRGKWLMQ